jgi:hypothetical protein
LLPGFDWAWSYLTKNVSIVYHHCEANDENVVDDSKAMDDGQQDDWSTMNAMTMVAAAVAAVEATAVENVLD